MKDITQKKTNVKADIGQITIYDENNIALRAGHHCAQLITKWLGCLGTLRATFYIYNDYQDIDKFIEVTKQAAEYFKEWV